MIIGLVVSSVLATGAVSKFYLPKLYSASVSFLPARQEVSGGGISFGGGDKDRGGGGGAAAVITDTVGGKSGPNLIDTFWTILHSRSMGERVVQQLNLMEYYGQTTMQDAVGALRGETTVVVTKQRSMEVIVLTRDPRMAADIANAYAANLDDLNRDLSASSSRQYRIFLVREIAEKVKELSKAEEALKTFQTENKALAVKEQAELASAAASDLRTQIVELEVELAQKRVYSTPNHPQINQLQVQLQELRRQLDRLEQDQAIAIAKQQGKRVPISKQVFPMIGETPALALEFLRLAREVKVQESVYGMLVGTLQQAKIAENRDVPTIQVLDPAILPLRHSRPKTLQNVQVAAAVSLVLGIMLAFSLDYLKRNQARLAKAARTTYPGETGEAEVADSNGNGRVEVQTVSPREVERLHG
jgi:uncharacterized protein involved in exopolysaccharide biosynthesis